MDYIHYKGREDGRILSRAVYIVLGIVADGNKDIPNISVGTIIHMRRNSFKYVNYSIAKKEKWS